MADTKDVSLVRMHLSLSLTILKQIIHDIIK